MVSSRSIACSKLGPSSGSRPGVAACLPAMLLPRAHALDAGVRIAAREFHPNGIAGGQRGRRAQQRTVGAPDKAITPFQHATRRERAETGLVGSHRGAARGHDLGDRALESLALLPGFEAQLAEAARKLAEAVSGRGPVEPSPRDAQAAVHLRARAIRGVLHAPPPEPEDIPAAAEAVLLDQVIELLS